VYYYLVNHFISILQLELATQAFGFPRSIAALLQALQPANNANANAGHKI
jgi:hypothetical protein